MNSQKSFVVICCQSEPYEAPNYRVVAVFSDKASADDFLLTDAGTDCYVLTVDLNPSVGKAVRKTVQQWEVYLEIEDGVVVKASPRLNTISVGIDESPVFGVFVNRRNEYCRWNGDVCVSGDLSMTEAVAIATEVGTKASELVKFQVSGPRIPYEFPETWNFDNRQAASQWFRQVEGSKIEGFTQSWWDGRAENHWFEYGDGVEVSPID